MEPTEFELSTAYGLPGKYREGDPIIAFYEDQARRDFERRMEVEVLPQVARGNGRPAVYFVARETAFGVTVDNPTFCGPPGLEGNREFWETLITYVMRGDLTPLNR